MSFGFWKLKDGIFEGNKDLCGLQIFVGFDQVDCKFDCENKDLVTLVE